MNMKRIIGIGLLVVGLILLFVGMNASHSAADQVSNTFTGRFTEATTWYMVGGIGSAAIGLLMVVFKGHPKVG